MPSKAKRGAHMIDSRACEPSTCSAVRLEHEHSLGGGEENLLCFVVVFKLN